MKKSQLMKQIKEIMGHEFQGTEHSVMGVC